MALGMRTNKSGKPTKGYLLQTPSGFIPIEIIKSNRRTIRMEIQPDASVVVKAPKLLPKREIKKFIEQHEEWIVKKVKQVRLREEKAPQFPMYEALTNKEKKEIREKIVGRVELYAEKMGVSYERIAIRNQKTRWGSCSSKGNLNFNYKLFYLPEELLDYVVVHELSHRIHMNHSKDFWDLVEVYRPNFKEEKKHLKEYQ